jgi:hypothetical protein
LLESKKQIFCKNEEESGEILTFYRMKTKNILKILNQHRLNTGTCGLMFVYTVVPPLIRSSLTVVK